MIIKLKSFSAFLAKLLQPLNFLTLSNDQNPAKPCHRPLEQSLFLFLYGAMAAAPCPPQLVASQPSDSCAPNPNRHSARKIFDTLAKVHQLGVK